MSHSSSSKMHATLFFSCLLLALLFAASSSVANGQSTPPTHRRGLRVAIAQNYSTELATHSQHHFIIDAENNTEHLLRFITVHKINALMLTDGIDVLTASASRISKLKAFISLARVAGVEWVECVLWQNSYQQSDWYTGFKSFFDSVATYQNGTSSEAEMFDGAVSSIGFGNTSQIINGFTSSWFTDPVTYSKSLYGRKRNNRFDYGCFAVPVPSVSQFTELDGVYDKIIIPSSALPNETWSSVSTAITRAAAISIKTEIQFTDMTGTNGDWYTSQKDPFYEAERIVKEDFAADAIYSSAEPNFQGFHFNSYEQALANTPNFPTKSSSPSATLTPAPTKSVSPSETLPAPGPYSLDTANLRRGIRVSLLRTSYGATNFSSDAKYAKFRNIIDSEANIRHLLRFVTFYGINTLTLYDIDALLKETHIAKLRSFITRARTVGVRWVEAVAHPHWKTSTRQDYDNITRYQNASTTNDSEMFDGIMTEVNWMNSTSLADGSDESWITGPVTYARSLHPRSRQGGGSAFYFTTEVPANVGPSQIATTLGAFDGVLDTVLLLAGTKTSPNETWSAVAGQMPYAARTSMNTQVVFNPAGLGDWFKNQTQPFAGAEEIFNAYFKADHIFNAASARFAGYQYSSYIDSALNAPSLPTLTPTLSRSLIPQITTETVSESVSISFMPPMHPVTLYLTVSPTVMTSLFGGSRYAAADTIRVELQQLLIGDVGSDISVQVYGNQTTGFSVLIVVHSTNSSVATRIGEALLQSNDGGQNNTSTNGTLAQLSALSTETVIVCDNSTIIEDRCKTVTAPPAVVEDIASSDAACGTGCIAGISAGGFSLLILIIIGIVVARKTSSSSSSPSNEETTKTVNPAEPIAVVSSPSPSSSPEQIDDDQEEKKDGLDVDEDTSSPTADNDAVTTSA